MRKAASPRCWSGTKPKYKHLLDDVDVKRWYDNVSRGSKITADVYLRRLGSLCNSSGLNSPRELVTRSHEEGGERWAYNFIIDVITQLESEGKAGSYIHSNIKAVKSWLIHNGIEIKQKLKIRGAQDTPTLRDKRALSGTELSLFFSNAPPQTRCAGVLVAQAGLRIETIGYYEGTDGLRIGDLPDLKFADDDEQGKLLVRFAKVPTMIVVRPELSKAGHQYFTFLAEEGCRHIADYLTQRLKSGENLASGSALISPSNSKPRKNDFVRSNLIGDLIRKRLRSCGINARPYDLRSTFATQLMLAESKGLIIRDYRVFFMGHKGDIEHRYTTHTAQGRLGQPETAGNSSLVFPRWFFVISSSPHSYLEADYRRSRASRRPRGREVALPPCARPRLIRTWETIG